MDIRETEDGQFQAFDKNSNEISGSPFNTKKEAKIKLNEAMMRDQEPDQEDSSEDQEEDDSELYDVESSSSSPFGFPLKTALGVAGLGLAASMFLGSSSSEETVEPEVEQEEESSSDQEEETREVAF
jgi:hypothetical protein